MAAESAALSAHSTRGVFDKSRTRTCRSASAIRASGTAGWKLSSTSISSSPWTRRPSDSAAAGLGNAVPSQDQSTCASAAAICCEKSSIASMPSALATMAASPQRTSTAVTSTPSHRCVGCTHVQSRVPANKIGASVNRRRASPVMPPAAWPAEHSCRSTSSSSTVQRALAEASGPIARYVLVLSRANASSSACCSSCPSAWAEAASSTRIARARTSIANAETAGNTCSNFFLPVCPDTCSNFLPDCPDTCSNCIPDCSDSPPDCSDTRSNGDTCSDCPPDCWLPSAGVS
mmetsp:Transcript_16804/g.42910  ORF Transcript_16804/g.42910 Transcript_16804/m.42910 type:complete len:290 (-) Transcript_16804:869-1738(-)